MSRRAAQLSFDAFTKAKDCFGGSLLKNSRARTKRPLASKLPMHVVLKSRRSVLKMPKTFGRVEKTITQTARKHGVRVYESAKAQCLMNRAELKNLEELRRTYGFA